jgi:2-haloacid dehalogenase
VDRWATFDCYGTLVDWNRGIGDELARLFGEERRAELLGAYHALEPVVERDGSLPYRDVLAQTLAGVAAEAGLDLPARERDALARSLPTWPVFPEVPGALAETRRRGWMHAVLSTSDRDFIEASLRAIGVTFELAVVAGEIGSYKPAHGHWLVFRERTGAAAVGHVHVGASLYHDVVPASELGIPVLWINRLGERADAEPTRELADLARLPDTLDELVPAHV